MTLNGDFSKDYCVLSVSNTSPSITIDSSQLSQYPLLSYEGESFYNVYESLNSTAAVTCSAGEYTVSISDYTNYGTFSFGNKSGYIYVDHYIGGVFYDNNTINDMMSIPFGEHAPRTFPSATISNGTGEAARFEFFYNFGASEQDILNMPDSFSTTLNYVISIDKLN